MLFFAVRNPSVLSSSSSLSSCIILPSSSNKILISDWDIIDTTSSPYSSNKDATTYMHSHGIITHWMVISNDRLAIAPTPLPLPLPRCSCLIVAVWLLVTELCEWLLSGGTALLLLGISIVLLLLGISIAQTYTRARGWWSTGATSSVEESI